ncbi:hypothetical protein JTB14_022539 [Gonioctena quinquepunctata]|nr:hypothetical protein JTB14_022539 [Gonioctena quinquepunctata]
MNDYLPLVKNGLHHLLVAKKYTVCHTETRGDSSSSEGLARELSKIEVFPKKTLLYGLVKILVRPNLSKSSGPALLQRKR